MKAITVQQIEAVLTIVYQTNIPAIQFDALKKLFSELSEVKEEEKK